MRVQPWIERRRRQQLQEAMAKLPNRGDGLHGATLGLANSCRNLGLSADAAIEAISAIDRDFKPHEVEEAVNKAFSGEKGRNNGTRGVKPREPMTKAAAAGRILAENKERAEQLQSALIEKGGVSIDPFSLEVRAMSNPQFELVSPIAGIPGSEHRRDMLAFLEAVFKPDDKLYIGHEMESKFYQPQHIKPVKEWLEFFNRMLNGIENETDPQEQLSKLVDLGDRFPYFVINPLTGNPDEKGSFRSNANVKEYSYVLLESDSLPLDQQIPLICGLGLKPVSMTFSGGKSIHTLLRVVDIPYDESVKNQETWDAVVKKNFFGQVAPLGFDKATSNPARLSRLPGIYRPDKGTFQSLLYINKDGGLLHV